MLCVIRIIGISEFASGARAMANASQYDGELDMILREAQRIISEPGIEKTVAAIGLIQGDFKQYMQHFISDSRLLNSALNIASHEILRED